MQSGKIHVPEDWWRFIDDCLFWWLGSKEELECFIRFMNNFHPSIKFTCEYSFETRSVNILDMRIYVDSDGLIQTDLFTKPNMKCQYLLPSSNHPTHITKNIPYSLAYRLRRICSEEENFNLRLEELKQLLLERGYRRRGIENSFDRVRQLERVSVLEKVERRQQVDRVKAVFRFDKRLPNIAGIMKQNWKVMVESDRRLKKVFEHPPLVCFNRTRNNREVLCRAKLPASGRGNLRQHHEDGFRRCGKGCKMCPFTGEETTNGRVLKSVKISSTGEEIQIKGKLTCHTENVLYLGTCTKDDRTCPDRPQYLGETQRRAMDRLADHVGTVTQDCHVNTRTPVGQHFRSAGHSVANLQFIPIEKIAPGADAFVRKAREKHLINKYNLIEAGLNKKL